MASSGSKRQKLCWLEKGITGRLRGWMHEYKVYSKSSGLEVIGKLFGKMTGEVAKLGKEKGLQ